MCAQHRRPSMRVIYSASQPEQTPQSQSSVPFDLILASRPVRPPTSAASAPVPITLASRKLLSPLLTRQFLLPLLSPLLTHSHPPFPSTFPLLQPRNYYDCPPPFKTSHPPAPSITAAYAKYTHALACSSSRRPLLRAHRTVVSFGRAGARYGHCRARKRMFCFVGQVGRTTEGVLGWWRRGGPWKGRSTGREGGRKERWFDRGMDGWMDGWRTDREDEEREQCV